MSGPVDRPAGNAEERTMRTNGNQRQNTHRALQGIGLFLPWTTAPVLAVIL